MVNALNTLYVVPISQDLSLSRSNYLLTSTFTAIACIFATPIIGRLMRRDNLLGIQSISTLIMAISYASFSMATSAWHLYLASFIIGLTYMAAGMIPISVMIANWFVEKQGLAMSIVFSGISIGGVILSPLTSSLILQHGWRVTRLYVSGFFILITIPTILFMLKASPEKIGLQAYGQPQAVKGSASREPTDTSLHIPNQGNDSPFLKKPYFFLLMIGMILSGAVCGGGMQHMGPFVTDLHDPMFASLIISLYSFSAIFGKLILGWLYDKYGNNQSLLFGGVLFVVSFILMAFFGNNKIIMLVASVFFGIGNSIGSINANFVTFSVFGKKRYAKMLSFSKSMQQIGIATGPLIIASMHEYYSSYRIPWIVSSILALAFVISWTKSYSLSSAQTNPNQ
jgi:MFS family permease